MELDYPDAATAPPGPLTGVIVTAFWPPAWLPSFRVTLIPNKPGLALPRSLHMHTPGRSNLHANPPPLSVYRFLHGMKEIYGDCNRKVF